MKINRTELTVSLSAPGTKLINDITTAGDPLSLEYTTALGSQSTDDAAVADAKYEARRTVAASTTETLDLYGALLDAFGDTINFARIKIVVIKNTSATGTLRFGGGSNPWLGPWGSGTLDVTAKGQYAQAGPVSGWTVTNSTADKLRVQNLDTNPATYEIVLIGNST